MNKDFDDLTTLKENENAKSNQKRIEKKNNLDNTFFSFDNFDSYKDNFDWKKYIMMNKDLKNIHTKTDAIDHWLNFGIKEKRTLYFLNKLVVQNKNNVILENENNFDWEKYKSFYPDLKKIQSKKDALKHWNKYGKKENRTFFLLSTPNSLWMNPEKEKEEEKNWDNFDWKIYVNNYNDLKHIDNKKKAWNHWIKNGIKEKRVLFDLHQKTKEDYTQIKKDDLIEGKEILLFDQKLIFKRIYKNYGLHYFGWKEVISSFLDYIQNPCFKKTFLLKEKIFFDEWIEKLLIWGNKILKNEYLNEIQENNYKLITFIHNPAYEKYFSFSEEEKQELEKDVLFHPDLLNKNVFETFENQFSILQDNILYLYTLSIAHKEWIYHHYPIYRSKIVSIHHPININNNNVLFNFNEFKINKKIFHVGWWLRNFKTFINVSFPDEFSKYILIKKDFENQWLNISIHFNLNNIKIVSQLDNEEYEKIFQNSFLFLDLEDTVANNVILECIKFCTPILVKKNDSSLEYLGENYPFYFTSLKDLKKMELLSNEEWLQKILYTHEYLVSMNKEHLLLETFNKKVSYDIEKLCIHPITYKLTWILFINKKEDLPEIENIIQRFLNQLSIEKLYLLFIINDQLDIQEDFSNKYSFKNISFLTIKNEKDQELSLALTTIILSLETLYFTILSIHSIYQNNFSEIFIEYLDNYPNCDVGFCSYTYHISCDRETIIKIYEKNGFFFKKNITLLKEENIIIPLVFRKNILNLLPYQLDCILFLEKCFQHHLNIACTTEEDLCTIYE